MEDFPPCLITGGPRGYLSRCQGPFSITKKEAVFLIVDHNMVLLEGFGKPHNISKLIMVEMPANKSPKNSNVAIDWR